MTDNLQQEAANPATTLERLAELAHRYPELRATVAGNPSTYPDLVEWLAQLGDPAIDAALRTRAAASENELAARPDTDPQVLADIAYRRPELRATVAANPAAYAALRDWIAAAGLAVAPGDESPAVAARQSPVLAATPPLKVKTLSAKGGWLLAGIAVVSVASLVAATFGVVALYNGVAQFGGNSATNAGSQTDGSSTSGNGSANGGRGQSAEGSSGTGGTTTPAVDRPHYIPTVLILDASGSMVRSIASGGTRMAAAKAAALTFVDGLGEEAEIGLIVFGTSTGNEDSDQAAGCFDIKTFVPVSTVDKTALSSAISGIKESGFTPLGGAMRSAAELLKSAPQAQIVLVSDGVDTCSPPPACEIAAELRASNPGLTINAVGFAVDADEQAQEQLNCIAAAGGGEYVDAGNADQLAARLRVLSDPVSVAGAVNPRGFEGLHLGMSMEQAKGANKSFKLGKVEYDIQYAECDDSILQFKNGRLYDIQPKRMAPTAEGVSKGDDLTRVEAIYGPPLSSGSDDAGTFAVYPTSNGSDSAYRVYYKPTSSGTINGKVVKIVICLCGTGGGSVSEISAWQFHSDGIGPLTLDMTASEVQSVRSGSVGPDQCGVVTMGAKGVGFQTYAYTSSRSSPRDVFAYRVHWDGTVASGAYPMTDRGVGIGSTRNDVLAAYPAATLITDFQRQSTAILTDASGVSLIFGFDDDETITDIQVGRIAALIREACAF